MVYFVARTRICLVPPVFLYETLPRIDNSDGIVPVLLALCERLHGECVKECLLPCDSVRRVADIFVSAQSAGVFQYMRDGASKN